MYSTNRVVRAWLKAHPEHPCDDTLLVKVKRRSLEKLICFLAWSQGFSLRDYLSFALFGEPYSYHEDGR